jgi:hypothetical protein
LPDGLKFGFFPTDSKREDKGVRQVRFQELRDREGNVIALGLHPAIAVVAANPPARATALAALEQSGGSNVVRADDVENELRRAALAVAREHEASVEGTRESVVRAERELAEAERAAEQAVDAASVAALDLSRFDELADRLASSEEAYEAAIRADAEAARSLAATLGDLDHVLGQRHSASTSLDQARQSRDHRGVPEAVLQQAVNVQTALAQAEAQKHQAVQQADDIYQRAGVGAAEAREALEAAHEAIREVVELISAEAPAWGPGIPLAGLVANYRDQLAARLSAAQLAETDAKAAEIAARTHLEQEQHNLSALLAAGLPQQDPLQVALEWARGERFGPEDAVAVDDAFARFGPDGAASLITTLAERGCQVIYLTEDPDVLSWAIGLPKQAGAATTVGVRSRKLALVAS